MAQSEKTYGLTRDDAESARLERQAELWNAQIGFHIDPQVRKTLPANAQIAELATGTAAWLRGLAPQLPASTELHGWDISDQQFPPASSLPSNLHLHVHDATQPFDSEWVGRFDVVHIRLLILGLSREDWAAVAQQALTILKPGGWIQWDEADFTKTTIVRTGLDASTTHLTAFADKFVEVFGDQLNEWENLPRVLTTAGFDGVTRDAVQMDRVAERRMDMPPINVLACYHAFLAARKLGKLTDWTEEKAEAERQKAMEDIATGAYWSWTIYVFSGQKPVSG